MFANALFADGSDLLRIASASRQWEADVTVEFNVESRELMDQKEAGGRVSSTGSGPASSGMGTGSGPAVPVSGTVPAASSGTAPAVGSSTAPDPAAASSTAPAAPVQALAPPSTGSDGSTSAAARTRPMGLWGLFRSLMRCPAP